MTTEEKNKLIAKFMGGKLNREFTLRLAQNEIWLPHHGICKIDTIESGKGKIMRYHSSWDWLMPVVEKIESIKMPVLSVYPNEDEGYADGEIMFGVCIVDKGADIWTDVYPQYWGTDREWKCFDGKTKIEATYNAVVQFIKWYNQNKQS